MKKGLILFFLFLGMDYFTVRAQGPVESVLDIDWLDEDSQLNLKKVDWEELKNNVRRKREDVDYIPPYHESPKVRWAYERANVPSFALARDLEINHAEKLQGTPYEKGNRPDDSGPPDFKFEHYAGISGVGIESMKGGIFTLLDILIDGQLIANYYGPLVGNDPGLSAGPHGPFYVILNDQKIEKRRDERNSSDYARLEKRILGEDYVLHYLVPLEHHRKYIQTVLELAQSKGILQKEEVDRIMQKVLIMAEFTPQKAEEIRQRMVEPDEKDKYDHFYELPKEQQNCLHWEKALPTGDLEPVIAQTRGWWRFWENVRHLSRSGKEDKDKDKDKKKKKKKKEKEMKREKKSGPKGNP